MRLSTKGRYAVMAMVDLAQHSAGDPISLAEIAERQEISLSYLEQLFAMLRKGGLVKSVRGPGGGYLLAHDSGETRIADIILAVDEPIDATQCGGKENCRDDQKCITHDLWAKLNDHILEYLRAVTLKQMVDGQQAKAAGVAQVQDMRDTVAKRDRTPVSA